MRIVPITLYAMVLFSLSCTSEDAEVGGTPTPLPTPSMPATLSNVQDQVFTPSCTNTGCHDATAAGSLDLTSGKSYAGLVGVAAVQTQAASRAKIRVIAGDPTNSFLLQKLDGTMKADEGAAMPRNESAMISSKISLVRQWIQDGAQNN